MIQSYIKTISATLLLAGSFTANAQCLDVTCTPNVAAFPDSGSCTATVNYALPSGLDICTSDTVTFSYADSIERFVVPPGITSINLEAWGASGGNTSYSTLYTGGLGAYMSGTFAVTPGQVLHILVGQAGESAAVGGGGGGSFIVDSVTQTPLLVAGGGGGASSDMSGIAASITENGTMESQNIISGGTSGNGGAVCATLDQNNGGGGGGFYTNGGNSNSNIGGANGGFGGFSFLNGGTGGAPGRLDGACTEDAYGGFGGGGGTSCNTVGGGGGGGYSGGAGGLHLNVCGAPLRSGGGGGGSFNSGTNTSNLANVNTGNGQIKISYLGTTAGVTTTLVSGLGSGGVFPIGVTTETYETTLGMESFTCTFTVTVNDSIPPSFDGVIGDSAYCAAPGALTPPSVTDNCTNTVTYTLAGATTASGTGDASAETFNDGVTTVTYTVTDQSGNTDDFSFNVTINPLPVISAQADTTICIEMGAITLQASPATGSWSGTGVSGSMFDPSVAGVGSFELTYTATTPEGCSDTWETTIIVNDCAGIDELSGLTYALFPNPSKDAVTLELGTELTQAKISILDLNGKVLFNQDYDQLQKTQLDVSNLPSGIFFVRINANNSNRTIKLVKE